MAIRLPQRRHAPPNGSAAFPVVGASTVQRGIAKSTYTAGTNTATHCTSGRSKEGAPRRAVWALSLRRDFASNATSTSGSSNARRTRNTGKNRSSTSKHIACVTLRRSGNMTLSTIAGPRLKLEKPCATNPSRQGGVGRTINGVQRESWQVLLFGIAAETSCRALRPMLQPPGLNGCGTRPSIANIAR